MIKNQKIIIYHLFILQTKVIPSEQLEKTEQENSSLARKKRLQEEPEQDDQKDNETQDKIQNQKITKTRKSRHDEDISGAKKKKI